MGGICGFPMISKAPSHQRIKGQPALVYGQYHITSVGRKEYLGVFTEPGVLPPPPVPASAPVIPPPPFPAPAPVIVLRPSVLPPRFTVVPVDVEAGTYVILVERRVTRGQDNRVFASKNEPAEVWLISYNKDHDAYTIQKREIVGPFLYLGWTAPSLDGAIHPDQILLERFLEPGPLQLFKFERVGAE